MQLIHGMIARLAKALTLWVV